MIITVSRKFAAGGSEVARKVAERLGWTLVDNQVVDEVARRAGLPREEVAEGCSSSLDRTARGLDNPRTQYRVQKRRFTRD